MVSESNPYRETFIAVRGLLQAYDPHGLMRLYSGDRFDDQIYGYEATTLIERVRSNISTTSVLAELNALAAASRRDVDQAGSNTAAAKISEVLNAL